jgi:hypothetical protein
MPLMIPTFPGFLDTEASAADTSSAGVTITANSTPHQKSDPPVQVLASTAARSLGILVAFENTAVGNTSTSYLVDIMTGTGGSEVVLLPDLNCGFALPEGVSNTFVQYYFPLHIPSGTRIAARGQAQIASDTVTCRIHLFQRPRGFGWVGSRVTAYGVTSASSQGTNVTHGNNAYGTAAQLAASTTNPIRYMQIGFSGGSDASLTDFRVLADVRLGASTSIAGPLMGSTDTGTESVLMSSGNATLSRMAFNLPAGQDLRVAGMVNGSVNNVLDYIVYGVD